MPYAGNGLISQDPIDGGVEITQTQYVQALDAMLAGKIIAIEGDSIVIEDGPGQETPTPNADPLKKALTRRQLLMGLYYIGIVASDIESVISQIADQAERDIAMIEWQEAGKIDRNHPLVEDLIVEFNLVPSEVDDLWVWASGL